MSMGFEVTREYVRQRQCKYCGGEIVVWAHDEDKNMDCTPPSVWGMANAPQKYLYGRCDICRRVAYAGKNSGRKVSKAPPLLHRITMLPLRELLAFQVFCALRRLCRNGECDCIEEPWVNYH